MKRRIFTTAALGFALAGSLASGPAFAQTRWDLASAYPATNFHSENMAQLAADVDKATGGAFKITLHANASLFKAPEIKRAVQGAQAQMGEIIFANFQNEWQIYGADGQPLRRSETHAGEKAGRTGNDAAVLRSLAAPRPVHQKAD